MKSKFVNEIKLNYQKKLFVTDAVSCSADVLMIVKEIFRVSKSKIDLKEYFFVIMLNRANKVIGYIKLSEGGISQTVVDVRLAFATAIKCLASNLILIHNHPSGSLRPSQNDNAITKNFCEAGKLLEIDILDHIIISSEGHYSFRNEGLMPN